MLPSTMLPAVVQDHAKAGIAGDNVAGASSRRAGGAANRVGVAVDVDAVARVRDGCGAGGVRPDLVPHDEGVGRINGDTCPGVARDDVDGAGGRTTDRIAGAAPIRMPSALLGTEAVPAAFVPIMLPAMRLPVAAALLISIPFDVLPEITLPAAAPRCRRSYCYSRLRGELRRRHWPPPNRLG